jgi:predicted MPP superfamily phosphohydrolase
VYTENLVSDTRFRSGGIISYYQPIESGRALVVFGLIFVFGVFTMMTIWPAGWSWEPRQAEYEHMIVGVYAVLGNHDWWLDPKRVQSALEAENIPVMEDRSIKIIYGECEFSLVGISDFWEGPHDVKKALSSVSKNGAVLLFTHNPDVFPEVPDHVTLTVAGHTHGGQVYIPGIGRPVVPSKYDERFAIGHVIEYGRHLFVSSGIGTSILPVRFLVPPEITLLVLETEAK